MVLANGQVLGAGGRRRLDLLHDDADATVGTGDAATTEKGHSVVVSTLEAETRVIRTGLLVGDGVGGMTNRQWGAASRAR